MDWGRQNRLQWFISPPGGEVERKAMDRAVKEIVRGIGLHPLKLLHAFLYGRFTPQYLRALDWLAPHLPSAVKDHLAETYHGKVLRLEDASQILSLQHDLEARGLEKVVPYKYARDLILKNPHHIVVCQCACRSVQENPCQPLDVCLIVGDPFARAALAVQPGKCRQIDGEEALAILRAEHERGHIHTAYFKDVMLGRFFAICNCCSCCCLQMRAYREHGMRILAPSGYVATVSPACDGCGQCLSYCQFGAIEVQGQATVNYEKCFGCGQCQAHCPLGAISLERDPGKGEPLDIMSLAHKSPRSGPARSEQMV